MFQIALRLLPPALRRKISRARQIYRLKDSHFDLSKYRASRVFEGTHVAVAGVFSAGSGLARAAELVAKTLEDQGSIVSRIDLTSSLGLTPSPNSTSYLSPADCYHLDISDVVFVANPDQAAIATFDRSWLVERTIIGHWIWEIETLPTFWIKATRTYDEIWAPTDILQKCFAKNLRKFSGPIKVVPYSIASEPFPVVDQQHRAAIRADRGISNSSFVVGYSFSVDSNYYRKNPEDAVRAFFAAFPVQGAEQLLLRCNDLSHRPFERKMLESVIGGDPRVRIFDSSNRISIADFYSLIDVYVSSSRSEGYGLNLVEASQCGLPVITGGWNLAAEVRDLPGLVEVPFTLIPLKDPQGHYADLTGAVWSAPDVSALAQAICRSKELRFSA
ncbi:glycosyltransferase [Tardiphaga sp.]|uniref:glycosyltransferase n=1 Tax=Tardiphaga sp. TaxID=1926292 RepID=UPI00352ACC1C